MSGCIVAGEAIRPMPVSRRYGLLGQRHRAHGVLAVAVRADFVGVFLGDGGAADEDFDLVAHAGLFEGVNGGLHGRHGGGEQGGHGDDIGLFFVDGRDELLRGHVDAQVNDLEAAAFEQRGDQVLADVVQIAFDGADGDAADRLVAAGGQERADEFERGLHRAGGDEQLGHEVLVGLEPAAHFIHGGDHVLVDQLERVNARRPGLVG